MIRVKAVDRFAVYRVVVLLDYNPATVAAAAAVAAMHCNFFTARLEN